MYPTMPVIVVPDLEVQNGLSPAPGYPQGAPLLWTNALVEPFLRP